MSLRIKGTVVLTILLQTVAACESSDSAKSPPPSTTTQRTSQDGKKTCLNIINGQKTSQYPAVVLLMSVKNGKEITGKCTGTFVSHNTLITASHCMKQDVTLMYLPGTHPDVGTYLNDVPRVISKAIRPLKSIYDEYDSKDGKTDSRQVYKDIAILVFPDNTAPSTMPILERNAAIGDDVALVGYGRTDVGDADDKGANGVQIKRIGKNKYKKLKTNNYEIPEGSIVLGNRSTTTDDSGKATDSGSAQGDSGGPLIIENSLAGVVSSGGLSEDVFKDVEASSHYASLKSSYAKSLLKKAESSGASYEATGKTDSSTTTQCD